MSRFEEMERERERKRLEREAAEAATVRAAPADVAEAKRVLGRMLARMERGFDRIMAKAETTDSYEVLMRATENAARIARVSAGVAASLDRLGGAETRHRIIVARAEPLQAPAVEAPTGEGPAVLPAPSSNASAKLRLDAPAPGPHVRQTQ